MAIARLNKLKVFIHSAQKDELLQFLQEDGSFEIIDLKSQLKDDMSSLFLKETEDIDKAKTLDKTLQELGWLIDFISHVNRTKRYIIKKREFQDIAGDFDYCPILKKAKDIETTLRQLDTAKKGLTDAKSKLSPWRNLNISLKDIARGDYVVTGIGCIRLDSLAEIKEEFAKLKLDIYLEGVNQIEKTAFLFYIYLKKDEDAVEGLFKKYALEHVYFPQYKNSAPELLNSIDKKLNEIDYWKDSLLEDLAKIASKKKEAMILYDYFSNLYRKQDASAKILMTEQVYLIEGWVKKKKANTLKEQMSNNFKEAEILLEEPGPQDDVPVVLENKKFIQPFELITKIYGMPAYKEVDPTPFFAPFFFIFFGLCITDVGYGIILALFSLLILKNARMGTTGKMFFKLLLYGGISTIILGALTGGWFGNAIDMLAEKTKPFALLKSIKDSLVLLDPMKDPMKLLIAVLILGVIQIWFGHIVAIYGNIKNKRYLDAIMDQGSMFLFLSGFSGFILLFLGALPKNLKFLFGQLAIFGSIAIILTAGRANKTILAKIAYGAFVLYSTLSGYISDILSYSRLWALGLVTGVMAATCNLIATLIGDMVPFFGFIISAIILLAGHLITLLMSLLGAFIHPMRLQFVEFFTKFFRGGGRAFKPLRLENKFTIIK